MGKKFACALVCLISFFVGMADAASQSGDLITVEAEGFAPIVDGQKNNAKEAAKRAAYRDALEKALGAYVSGITEMQNYEVVKDKVFSQATGIVKKFDIVREKVGDDGIFYITAVCQVAKAAMDGVLGPAVLDALGNPRVMVLIDEKIGSERPFLSTTEGEVMRVFEKAGYLLVDAGQSMIMNADMEALRGKEDIAALIQLARNLNADVMVYGKAYGSAFANQRVSGVMVYGVRSTVQLKAVVANTAYQLGSDVFEEKTKGVSVEDGAIKGFQVAAPRASGSIVNKIAYALISGSAGGIPGRTIKVKISNLSFKDAKDIREKLQGVHGVSGAYQRAFRDKRLEIDIVGDKTAEELADILSEMGCEIDDMSSATLEGSFNEPSAKRN